MSLVHLPPHIVVFAIMFVLCGVRASFTLPSTQSFPQQQAAGLHALWKFKKRPFARQAFNTLCERKGAAFGNNRITFQRRMLPLNLGELPLDDVWSFLEPESQAELRATKTVIAERFNRACELGCVEYFGIRMSPFRTAHYPFDPRNNVDPKAERVFVDLRFRTFDVSTTLTSEMIIAHGFTSLRAFHLTVTGMAHLRAIEDNFLAHSGVGAVSFDGGTQQLQSIGCRWLANCKSLVSVSFEGLSPLKAVGAHWLNACNLLTTVSFAGLSSLESISDYWLSHNSALTSISFEGLSSLKRVGNRWLNDCSGLSSLNFAGLSNLESVGDYWLLRNPSLSSVSFEGLTSLKMLRDSWFKSCPHLSADDLVALLKLQPSEVK